MKLENQKAVEVTDGLPVKRCNIKVKVQVPSTEGA